MFSDVFSFSWYLVAERIFKKKGGGNFVSFAQLKTSYED